MLAGPGAGAVTGAAPTLGVAHPTSAPRGPDLGSVTDVDRFIADNRATWARLDELVGRAARGRLPAPELDELVRLYLRASSHLSTARTVHRDPALTLELAGLVAGAHGVVYGTRARTWRAVGRFFTVTFPAAMWHARRPILASAVLFVVAAVVTGVWLGTTDAAVEALAPPEVRAAYVDADFEAYYSSQPAGQFAASVFTNNAKVGVLAFAVGIAWCVPTAAVLVTNGVNVGLAAGLFHAAGQAARFWGLILPHGLLELTAVFVAGGAGFRLGWTVIAPGDRTRPAALADEGRRAVVIVLGLVVVFLVAGAIEAFVTPSSLPTWARVGVGVVVEAAFLTYTIGLGRQAARRGMTGALGEERAVDRLTPVPVP